MRGGGAAIGPERMPRDRPRRRLTACSAPPARGGPRESPRERRRARTGGSRGVDVYAPRARLCNGPTPRPMTAPPQKPPRPLLDAPAHEALVLDGAMGTQLYERGVHYSTCFEEL